MVWYFCLGECHPEKDILNSRIVIPKIQPRIFFLATSFILEGRILFLGQEFFSCLQKKSPKNKILMLRE